MRFWVGIVVKESINKEGVRYFRYMDVFKFLAKLIQNWMSDLYIYKQENLKISIFFGPISTLHNYGTLPFYVHIHIYCTSCLNSSHFFQLKHNGGIAWIWYFNFAILIFCKASFESNISKITVRVTLQFWNNKSLQRCY